MSPKKDPPKTLAERVATLENDMGWVKKILEKIDRRTYYILASVIISILLAIVVILSKLA